MNIYQYTALKIQALRKAKNMTQRELAKHSEISLYRMKKIEKGLKCMKVTDLVLISMALDTETCEILEGYEY